jgi:hypothetical protein
MGIVNFIENYFVKDDKKINGEPLCEKYLWHFLPKNPKACRGAPEG